MTQSSSPDLGLLFEPRSVAIVGASSNKLKSGGSFLYGMLRDQYAGQIFPVNRNETEMMGLKCYPDLDSIPGEVDLAILAIPGSGVTQAVEDCVRKRVKFGIVHAVGFSEIDSQGKENEKKMASIAREGGLRLIGPNCMGIYSSRGRINTVQSFVRLPFDAGGVAFVGQSGWVSEVVLRLGGERGLRFSGVVSIGNQSDLTIEDLIEYWGDDPNTKIIGAYVEGLKQPRRFLDIARRVCRKKPVIIWKGGSSELGARSAASHTGSMAGSYEVFRALCRQTGISLAGKVEEVIDFAVAFNSPVQPKGNRLGLLIEAGGGGVASSDASLNEGLVVPQLPADVQKKLADYLKDRVPPSSNRKNPVDLVYVPNGHDFSPYTDALEMILPEVDVCLLMGYARFKDPEFRNRVEELRDRFQRPVLLVPGNPAEQAEGMRSAVMEGLPAYTFPDNAVRSIGAQVRRVQFLKDRP